mmetsp:Transcript_954/g.2964  ORF Transcript_954/g.2964 Transcript_954/m.2964 type:complete len:229 (+) Transcript_954:170-856(+)
MPCFPGRALAHEFTANWRWFVIGLFHGAPNVRPAGHTFRRPASIRLQEPHGLVSRELCGRSGVDVRTAAHLDPSLAESSHDVRRLGPQPGARYADASCRSENSDDLPRRCSLRRRRWLKSSEIHSLSLGLRFSTRQARRTGIGWGGAGYTRARWRVQAGELLETSTPSVISPLSRLTRSAAGRGSRGHGRADSRHTGPSPRSGGAARAVALPLAAARLSSLSCNFSRG